MKNNPYLTKSSLSALCLGLAFAGTESVQAETWNGGIGKFEDPTAWASGNVPASSAQVSFQLNADGAHCTADADTWTYLTNNGLLQSSTTYRGVNRALFGQTQSGTQEVSFTLDIGNANTFQLVTNASNNFGERQNTTTTVNIVSGTIETGGQATFANNALGTATLNVSGGTFRVGRSSLRVGLSGGNALASISAGSLLTRTGLEIDINSTFEIQGSGATEIGIGSHASGDGFVNLAGTVRALADSGGITPIFVDDQGGGATATFDSGSLLDVGFVGAPVSGTWTVLELEGAAITDNGIAFAPGVDTGVWSFNVDNTGPNGLLTVTAVSPELVWDGNINGDWDLVTANWQGGITYSEPTGALFDDTLSGTSTVNLTGTFSSANIVVDNTTNDYAFTGTGQLSGVTGLIKDGTGELTLSNTGGNDFTGPLQINNGTLTLGDATAFGDSGSALDMNGGIVDLGGFSVTKNTTDISGGSINNGTLTSPITAGAGIINADLAGAGTTVTKIGAGTLLLAGNNTYEGLTSIGAGGILQLGSDSALGTSSTSTSNINVENDKVVDALSGDPILLLSDTSGLMVGDVATSTGIPAGAVIISITEDFDVTLDMNATVTDVALDVTFSRTETIETTLGATEIPNDATLDLNGSTTSEIITILSGNGVGGIGAIINSDTVNPGEITTTIDDVGLFTVGGAGDVILPNVTEPAGVTRGITKVGAGTLTLGGDLSNNRIGLTVNEGDVNLSKTSGLALGRFALIVNNAASTVTLQGSDQIHNNADSNGTMQINEGSLDLNGFDENFGRLDTSTGVEPGGTVTNSSGTASTLTLIGGSIDATFPGTVSGNLSLVKQGTNTQTFDGTISYTGDTSVEGGILSIAGATLDDSSAISIAAGAFLDLAHALTDTVDTLTIGGVGQAAGVYGAIASGAANEVAEITGTGLLNVLNGPSASDYDTWMIAESVIGGPNDDDDNDGRTNFDEYAFGLAPLSGASSSPFNGAVDTLTGTFIYTRRNIGLSGLTYTYRESDDIVSGFDPFVPTSEVSDSGSPIETVTVTVPAALLGANPTLLIQITAE